MENSDDVWRRVIAKRVNDCHVISKEHVATAVGEALSRISWNGIGRKPADIRSALEILLRESRQENLAVAQRRIAFEALKRLLTTIDDLVKSSRNSSKQPSIAAKPINIAAAFETTTTDQAVEQIVDSLLPQQSTTVPNEPVAASQHQSQNGVAEQSQNASSQSEKPLETIRPDDLPSIAVLYAQALGKSVLESRNYLKIVEKKEKKLCYCVLCQERFDFRSQLIENHCREPSHIQMLRGLHGRLGENSEAATAPRPLSTREVSPESPARDQVVLRTSQKVTYSPIGANAAPSAGRSGSEASTQSRNTTMEESEARAGHISNDPYEPVQVVNPNIQTYDDPYRMRQAMIDNFATRVNDILSNSRSAGMRYGQRMAQAEHPSTLSYAAGSFRRIARPRVSYRSFPSPPQLFQPTLPSINQLPVATNRASNPQTQAVFEASSSQPPSVEDLPPPNRTVTFGVDPFRESTKSSQFAERLEGRIRTTVHFHEKPIDDMLSKHFYIRLREWEPYWDWTPDMVVAHGLTSTVQRQIPMSSEIRTASQLQMPERLHEIQALSNVKWGKQLERRDKEHALILRMLPMAYNSLDPKRADCHLWPKGTFIQINGVPMSITQRRQQSHDEEKWLGICKEFVVSSSIQSIDKSLKIEIGCFDDSIFYYSLCVCQYISPDRMFHRLVNGSLIRENGVDRAKAFANRHRAVSIEVDTDDEEGDEQEGMFVFSLLCPISRSLITTPVRGKDCGHWMCFDLQNYIAANATVSGGRWRCAVCETFVCLRSLRFCELTASIIEEFRDQITDDRHRVQFKADGSYELLPAVQRKRRRRGEAPGANVEQIELDGEL